MTLLDWLYAASYHSNKIALRENGKIWDIWELLSFVQRCIAIPRFGYGQMLKATRVYAEGHWLVSEDTGALLYEVIPNPHPKPIISITGRVIQG
jgi:hypothetical protein